MVFDKNLERIAKSIEGKEGSVGIHVSDVQFLLDTIYALQDQVNFIKDEEIPESEQDEDDYDEEGDCTNCFGLGCSWCE